MTSPEQNSCTFPHTWLLSLKGLSPTVWWQRTYNFNHTRKIVNPTAMKNGNCENVLLLKGDRIIALKINKRI